VKGDAGFVDNSGFREQFKEFFTDEAVRFYTLFKFTQIIFPFPMQQLDRLGLTGDFPLINQDQNEIQLDMRITKPGQYVLLLNYFSASEKPEPSVLHIETSTQTGKLNF